MQILFVVVGSLLVAAGLTVMLVLPHRRKALSPSPFGDMIGREVERILEVPKIMSNIRLVCWGLLLLGAGMALGALLCARQDLLHFEGIYITAIGVGSFATWLLSKVQENRNSAF